MRRYSLVLAALAVAGAFSPMAAKAAFVDFVTLPAGHTDQISLAGSTLSGTDMGIAGVTGIGTPLNNGYGPTLYGAHLDFTTGPYTGTDASGDFLYGPGGTVTLSDSTGTIFAGKFTGTTTLLPETGGLFKILAAGFAGQLASSIDNYYGLSAGLSSAGTLSLNFAVTPTGGLQFLSGDVSIDPDPQGPPIGAPEPASMALVALGLPLAAVVARRRARKASAAV